SRSPTRRFTRPIASFRWWRNTKRCRWTWRTPRSCCSPNGWATAVSSPSIGVTLTPSAGRTATRSRTCWYRSGGLGRRPSRAEAPYDSRCNRPCQHPASRPLLRRGEHGSVAALLRRGSRLRDEAAMDRRGQAPLVLAGTGRRRPHAAGVQAGRARRLGTDRQSRRGRVHLLYLRGRARAVPRVPGERHGSLQALRGQRHVGDLAPRPGRVSATLRELYRRSRGDGVRRTGAMRTKRRRPMRNAILTMAVALALGTGP